MSTPQSVGVRFPEIDDQMMTDDQRRVSRSIREGRGSLAGPFNAMLRSPLLADLLQQTGAFLRFTSPIDERYKELAIIMVARFWNAQVAWCVHSRLALEAGLARDKAEAIAEGRMSGNLDSFERAIYQFTGQLLREGRVSDACFNRMRALFPDSSIAEFIALVGYYSTAAFYMNVDRQPLPDGATALPDLDHPPFEDALRTEQASAPRSGG